MLALCKQCGRVEKSGNQVSAWGCQRKKPICASEPQQVSGFGDPSLGMWKHTESDGGDMGLKRE